MPVPDRRECWSVDPERSALAFSLRHSLLGHIRGQFSCWGGRVQLDLVDPLKTSLHIWADMSSLDTGSQERNEAIFATELFDALGEPALTFDGDVVEMRGDGHALVRGWLGLRSFGEEVTVALDLSPFVVGESGPRLVAVAQASIDRRALGLRRARDVRDWLSEWLVSPTIEMTAQVEARPAPR